METETSQSRPLPFGVLEVDSLGQLGHCGCPGSKTLDAALGPQLRDLNADLEQLKRAGFETFIALALESEYSNLQLSIKELAQACRNLGLEFIHLPQLKGDEESFERRWVYVGARLRYLLGRGHGVVIQGEGNRDRRRYIIARALLESGKSLDAVERLFRTQGLGAFQDQEHRESLQKLAQQLKLGLDLQGQDRRLGAIVLGALGDSLGSLVEFDRLERIRARFGESGLRPSSLPLQQARHLGDDSQMTLFSAEALVEDLTGKAELNAEEAEVAIRRGLRRWRMSQEAGPSAARGRKGLLGRPELWVSRKPNGTCLSALEAQGPAALDLEQKRVDDSGAMTRMVAVAILGTRFSNSLLVFSLARRVAALTHSDQLAQWPAAVAAVVEMELMAGRGFSDALQGALNFMPQGEDARAITRLMEAGAIINDPESLIPEVLEELSAGITATEVLVLSLACARSASSPEMALSSAANHSGKSDTIAALAGQFYGAHHGLGTISASWLASLELADVIIELGLNLARQSSWRPTLEMIESMRTFLPFLESPPDEIVIHRDDDIMEYCEDFVALEATLYRQGWAEPHQQGMRPEDFDFILRAPELVDEADEDGLRRILVAQLRKDRASLETAVRSGLLARIIRRLTKPSTVTGND